jgi:hypothetical protein
VAVGAALVAAALFAVASALQHRSTSGNTTVDGIHGRTVARFVRQTVAHPLWLAGTLADAGGLAFHALALHSGTLTLVQPLLVTGLVFALPLRQLIDHRTPDRREVVTAAILTVGLVSFLLAATPPGASAKAADPIPTAVTAAVSVLVVGVCLRVGRRGTGTQAATALGFGAGLAFATVAALLKATTDTLSHGLAAVVTSWPLYGVITVGAVGLVLNQLAFQAGPLRSSLPAISIVDPVASVIIGIAVYDERLRAGLLSMGAGLLGLLVVVAATFSLSQLTTSMEPSSSGEDITGRT